MPTLLAMSRLIVPAEAQGKSLVPLLAGTRWDPRPAYSEKAETTGDSDSPPPHDTESFSVTEDGWKLIRNDKRATGTPQFELYEALRDPLNLHDVAAAHPEIVTRLSRSLASWKSSAEAARIAVEKGSKEEMKPEDLERLRSLGYIR
jgi:arylsulfatase A-like enzyme